MTKNKFATIVAMSVILITAVSIQAQTLKADYQFQGNLDSSVAGAPALTNLTGANGANTFGAGTVDGFSRQVLNFPLNSGVAISDLTGVVPTDSFTLAMLFKISAISGNRRIADISGGTAPDAGVFLLDGRFQTESTLNPSISADTYVQLVVTRGGGNINYYRDGNLRMTEPDDGSPIPAGIRFFQDYVNNPSLASAGSVARIRLYDSPMTSQQVHQLDRVPEALTGTMPILFFSGRNGPNEVYRMNADGSSQQRLTNNEFGENALRFSPDGQKIVYNRSEGSGLPPQIWIMNADGSNQTRLTNTATSDQNASWRPDGQKILFSRCDTTTFVCDLYTMDPNGSGQAPITAANTAGDEDQARFTPDGTKLVYLCGTAAGADYNICVSNADGTNRTNITNTTSPIGHSQLDISPDSQKIVCIRGTSGPTNELYSMNINGTGLTQLTTNSTNDFSPQWSPDGTKIAWSTALSAAGPTNEIYIMNANGTAQTRITFNSAGDRLQDWYRTAGTTPTPTATPTNTPTATSTLTATSTPTSTSTPTPAATCVPPPNMVSWWRAENDAVDYFNVNNGTFAAATYALGKVGQAFNLNGTTSYVEVPDNPNLYPQAGSFTVDAWINTSQTTGYQQIIAHYECAHLCPSGMAASVYSLYLNGDKLEGEIRDSTAADQVLLGTRVIADGQFHHVAMMRDILNNVMRLYVDGTVEVSATLIPTGTITNDDFEADPVTIGAIIQNSSNGCGCPIQFFNGRIDEVQYYSRALTTPEIAGIFNAGSTGQCTPSISGTVTYGNALGNPTPPRFVSNVLISGAGSIPVSVFTAGLGATAGQYSLTGFGAGAYTVTPTKTGGVNGAISSFDAGKIALHVAGPPNPQLTGNQLVVADVSGNGIVSSFDAAMIAKFVAGPPYAAPGIGSTATWKFNPVNRNYASVTANVIGEDYVGLLMGEVSGNWANTGARPVVSGQLTVRSGRESVGGRQLAVGSWPERGIGVELPDVSVDAGKEVVIPVNVESVSDKGVISYEFDLRYDPSVIQPIADVADVKGTASRGLSVVTNASEPGLLRVVVYGALPVDKDGVLLNLRFTAIGKPGSVSPLSFERIMFNEGEPRVALTEGRVELF